MAMILLKLRLTIYFFQTASHFKAISRLHLKAFYPLLKSNGLRKTMLSVPTYLYLFTLKKSFPLMQQFKKMLMENYLMTLGCFYDMVLSKNTGYRQYTLILDPRCVTHITYTFTHTCTQNK